MNRLKFSYLRMSHTAERGHCWIDVLNPDDHSEIREKLQRREFSRFLPLDKEEEDVNWAYEPADEDEDDSDE